MMTASRNANIPSPMWVKYLKKESIVELPTNEFIFTCSATLSKFNK